MIKSTDTINGTYGSNETPCDIFVAHDSNGSSWYTVEGSLNVNCTYDELVDGVNVEEVQDCDCFTAGKPIESESDLEYWCEA